MSRKDYEAIAAAVRRNLEACQQHEELALRCVALDLADVFQADNPRFDRDRFLKACGL